MMKKTLIMVLMAALFMTACTGNGQKEQDNNQFKVNLTLTNAEGEMVYLQKVIDDSLAAIDSAVITNKLATLKAEKGNVQDLYVFGFKGQRLVPFFPENNDVTIEGDKNDLQNAKITASEAQKIMDEFHEQGIANDSVKLDVFIREHADSFISHFIVMQFMPYYSLDELKEYVSLFTTESEFKNKIEEYIEKKEQVAVGATAPDFTLQTVDGQDITLSELVAKNKLTLVDFWASWCGPCRGENPHVKAAYEKYNKKGFDVLGVSVDQDGEKWQVAVKEDGLTWTQVRDSESVASDLYSVTSIPSNFLLDPNGVIIATDLRGDDLKAKLAELLD